ncbi:MAG: Uma2 family endonuclease [Geminicoccaceae bacterium]|jgi:Uma2 family endonuclease
MADTAERLSTLDEFLAFDGEGDVRHQLVRGVITAMAPAQVVHGRLVARLARAMGNQLRAPCEPITEAGIKPAQRDDTYWQADLVVHCRPLVPGQIYLTDPRLVVEVLSASTEATDRLLKLDDYRLIESVHDILLVATERVRIEHWQRREGFWAVRDLGPGDVLEVAELGLEVALDPLYADLPEAEGEGGEAA